jgi:RimJ/RimL family protein N-acetyltransferase
LGYWIGKPYWGRGYGSAGAAQVVQWGFENLPLDRLTACCLERNPVSVRILEGLGFRFLGKEPNTNPKWLPTDVILRYELTRAERMRTRSAAATRAG